MKNIFQKIFVVSSITIVFLAAFVFLKPKDVSADGCVVSSAGFRHIVPTTDPGIFYLDTNRPIIYIDFHTQGCQGTGFNFSIVQMIGQLGSNVLLADTPDINIGVANDLHVPMPTGTPDNFTLVYKAGEDACGNLLMSPPGNAPGWDCTYYLEIEDSTGTHTANTIPTPSNGPLNVAGGGMLSYECEGLVCNTPWEAVPPILINFGATLPCGTDPGEDQYACPSNQANQGMELQAQDYYLAPLPGFSQGQSSDLGGFLRSFFTLLIVIAGVLAFIMIVIGGITYATSGAFGEKSAGKDMMLNAVLGLVLALGAWIILNTINPNLASNLGITIPKVNINPDFEPESSVGAGVDQITLNLAGGGTTSVTNCDANQMQQITAFGKTFKIYHGLVSSIQAVEAQWQAAGGESLYKIKSIGGYNCRKVKGTNSWSAHAFGVAVDINPAKNPFGQELETDMPPAFVQMWTSHGWGWGGGWDSVKDAMHFSKYPPSEDGDGIVTN